MSQMISPRNPFVGLRPFESEDTLYYFGRSNHTKALLQKMHVNRFLAVIGRSGCGKSSLVRAGLIPNLEAGFLVQDRDSWCIARMKPGKTPFQNLAQVLLIAIGEIAYKDHIEQFISHIRSEGVRAVLEIVQRSLNESGANLLILIDQFEEIFRLHLHDEGNDEAAEFVTMMLRLAEQSDVPIYICITMRSDYLGECDSFSDLPEAINKSQFLVPRLNRKERREAVTSPCHIAGATISPRLVDRLLNENIGTRDDLPILQHALMRTWAEWAKTKIGPLDLQHYETIHTVKHALHYDAEEALQKLTSEEQELAKRIFQTITETDSGSRMIKRPCSIGEIARVTGATSERIMAIIQKFREGGRLFLVLSSENPQDDPLVDISHESLIRQWQTLHRWVEEEAESAKTYRRLAESAELYFQGKAGVYREADLQVALGWKENQSPNEAWASRYHPGFHEALQFLDKSRDAFETESAKQEKARQERERLLQDKARLQRKIIIVTLFLSCICFFVAIFALNMSNEAGQKTMLANYNLAKAYEEKAMNLLKKAEIEKDFSMNREALLFTMAAMSLEKPGNLPVLSYSAVPALFSPAPINRAFSEEWIAPHSGVLGTMYPMDIAISPNGKTLATYSGPGSATKLWDIATRNAIAELYGRPFAFSPDSNILATGPINLGDTGIRLWDVKTGNEIKMLEGNEDKVYSFAFSPDGKILASWSANGAIRLWDVLTPKTIMLLEGHTDAGRDLAFSPDGKILASASWDSTIRLWEAKTGHNIGVLRGHTESVCSIAFSPDGKILASGSRDRTVRLWEVATGQGIKVLKGHNDRVWSVAFSPNGKLLSSGSGDTTIRIWDVSTGDIYKVLKSIAGGVQAVIFSRDGKMLTSVHENLLVRHWEVLSGKAIDHLAPGHSENVWGLAFSPDSKVLASGSHDGAIKLWEVSTGKKIATLSGHFGGVYSVAFSPDGKTLASGSGDTTIRLWDVETARDIRVLEGHTDAVCSVTFSPDSKSLASGARDNTIRLWDLETGREIRVLEEDGQVVAKVVFSPDGRTIVSAPQVHVHNWVERGEGCVLFWDISTGTVTAKLKYPSRLIFDAAFSPDGQFLALLGDEPIQLWSVQNKELVWQSSFYSGLFLNFSPDGKILCTGDRLFEAATGNLLVRLPHPRHNIASIAYSPDGKKIAVGLTDSSIRLWDITDILSFDTIGGSDYYIDIDFSPNGKILASWSIDRTLRLWEVASGTEIGGVEIYSNTVRSFAFSPDNNILALGSIDNTIRLWDLVGGKEIKMLEGHTEDVVQIAFSPNGKILASRAYYDAIRIWDIAGGNAISKLEGDESFAFSPDSKLLAVESQNNSIRIRDLTTNEDKVLTGHIDNIREIVFSPDGNTMASASDDHTVRLWDVATGREGAVLRHASQVYCVAFSPDGRILASGSQGGTVLLWEIETGRALAVLKGPSENVSEVVFSHDDRFLVSMGWGEAWLWEIESGRAIAQFECGDGAFSPNGKIFAGFQDNRIRLWDLRLLRLLQTYAKDRRVWENLYEAMTFLWQIRVYHMSIEPTRRIPILKPKDGYPFVYDEKFRSLLDPPPEGQNKFDQVFQWAIKQSKSK